ncbi:hypothetical protein PROFUN_02286 [Planoprotostelium fungivorum]|uniref:Uncharacterized protein n=1 Tax=Planoprotostelium fungivorum TaxID=1890364 RepID=A0A2P6NYL4_9EUKA|nr:hypothetical protein PROFUN_02286 [Planoprotostelium fungivorum]
MNVSASEVSHGAVAGFVSYRNMYFKVEKECSTASKDGNGVTRRARTMGPLTNSTNGTAYTSFYCDCSYYYDGESCETPWKADSRFMIFVNFYTFYTVFLNFVVICWVIYEIWKGGKKLWEHYSIVNYSMTLIALGALIRIVTWCIDVHTIREIMPAAAYQITFAIPQISWFSAGFGLAVYWMELVNTTRTKIGVFPKRYRILLRFLIAFCWIVLVPTSVCLAVFPASIGAVIAYNLGAVLLFVIFMGITILFGVKLVKQVEDTPRFASLKYFLRRIVRHMISIVIIFILIIISFVLFAIFGKDRWYYLSIHMTLRTEEFALCMSALFIFSRKRPQTKKTTMGSSSSSGGSVDIATKVVPISYSKSTGSNVEVPTSGGNQICTE